MFGFLLSEYGDLVLFGARVLVGAVLLYYGTPKIKNLRSNAEDFVKMGFKPGMFWGTIVAFVEFFGGVAMVLGVLVWAPALLFGFQMIVGTIWKITKTDKTFSDWSYDLLLFALMFVFLAFGPGAFALF